MRVSVSVKITGVDLSKATVWTADDSRTVGAAEAEHVVARVDGGFSAGGKRYIRRPGDTPLRRTGLMLDSFRVLTATEEGVVIDSAAPYASEVQKREDWSGITTADLRSIDGIVAESIASNLDKDTGPAV
jgi:hypothetical protein